MTGLQRVNGGICVPKGSSTVYVASCASEGGGIYQLRVDEKLRLVKVYPLDRPMYMAMTDSHLHVVLRQPFACSDDSGALRFSVEADGGLAGPGHICSTQGQGGCHILAGGKDVYVANYSSGSVIKMPDTLVRHAGRGAHPERQTAPHPHQCAFTPEGWYVCVPDLGLDEIIVYDRALRRVSQVKTPAGSGPRHMIFSPDGKQAFCANELDNTVSTFSYARGTSTCLHTTDALPDDRKKGTTLAAIRISGDGKELYTSNRGDNSISRFSVEGGKLRLESVADCGGESPRDFCLLPGGKLLVANERSDSLALFALRDGGMHLLDRMEGIPAPLCAVCKQGQNDNPIS